MKKCSTVITVALSITLLTSCSTRAGTGLLAGGLLGAGAGALIGGGTGALIGAGAGAVGGGTIGAILDESECRCIRERSERTYKRLDRGEQLSVRDVIVMHDGGLADEKIIELLQKTDSRFILNYRQIDSLKSAGVSERVIDYMIKR